MSEYTNTNIEIPRIIPDNQGDLSYTPSSIEKKRAVMMYLLFGIIIVISNKKVNIFEYFHLKQSIWWWLCFIMVIVFSIFLILLPWLKYIWILALLIMVILFIVFVKQAWDGKYKTSSSTYLLALFPWLWTWLVDLFEIWPSWENIQSVNKMPDSIGTNIDWSINIDEQIQK